MIASDGSAKRVQTDQFPRQGRYGQGITAWKLPAKISAVGMTVGEDTDKVVLFLERLAPRTIRLDEAPLQTRTARGKSILETKSADNVISLCVPLEPPRPGEGKPVEKRKRSAKPAAKPAAKAAVEPAAKAAAKPAAKSSAKAAAKPGAEPDAKSAPPAKKAPAAKTTPQAAPVKKPRKPRGV